MLFYILFMQNGTDIIEYTWFYPKFNTESPYYLQSHSYEVPTPQLTFLMVFLKIPFNYHYQKV